MKRLIIVVGVIAIVAILLGLYFSGSFASEYFEEGTTFGSWGQEIVIQYEDGTSESLAIAMNAPLSVLTYGGKNIIGFDYNLNAKLTGSGYDDATVTLGNYKLQVKILGPTGTQTSSYSLVSGAHTVPIDGAYHSIGGVANFPAKTKLETFQNIPGAFDYVITFTPTGTVTYQGNPSGDVQTSLMPSPVNVGVRFSKTATASIALELSNELPNY